MFIRSRRGAGDPRGRDLDEIATLVLGEPPPAPTTDPSRPASLVLASLGGGFASRAQGRQNLPSVMGRGEFWGPDRIVKIDLRTFCYHPALFLKECFGKLG